MNKNISGLLNRLVVASILSISSSLWAEILPASVEAFALAEAEEFATLISPQGATNAIRKTPAAGDVLKEANKMLFESSHKLASSVLSTSVPYDYRRHPILTPREFEKLGRKMEFAHELTQALKEIPNGQATEQAVARALEKTKAAHVNGLIKKMNNFVETFRILASNSYKNGKLTTNGAAKLASAVESRFGAKIENTVAIEIASKGIAYKGLGRALAGGLLVTTALTSWPAMAADEALSARSLGRDDETGTRDPDRFVASVKYAAELQKLSRLMEDDLKAEIFLLRAMLGIDGIVEKATTGQRAKIEYVFKLITNDPETLARHSSPPNIQALVAAENLGPVFAPLFRRTIDDDEQLATISQSGKVLEKRLALNKFMVFYKTSPEIASLLAYIKKYDDPVTFGLLHSDFFEHCEAAPGGRILKGESCADYKNFTKPLGYQEPIRTASPTGSGASVTSATPAASAQERQTSKVAAAPSDPVRSTTSAVPSQGTSPPTNPTTNSPARSPSSPPTNPTTNSPARSPSSPPTNPTTNSPTRLPSSPSQYPYAPIVR